MQSRTGNYPRRNGSLLARDRRDRFLFPQGILPPTPPVFPPRGLTYRDSSPRNLAIARDERVVADLNDSVARAQGSSTPRRAGTPRSGPHNPNVQRELGFDPPLPSASADEALSDARCQIWHLRSEVSDLRSEKAQLLYTDSDRQVFAERFAEILTRTLKDETREAEEKAAQAENAQRELFTVNQNTKARIATMEEKLLSAENRYKAQEEETELAIKKAHTSEINSEWCKNSLTSTLTYLHEQRGAAKNRGDLWEEKETEVSVSNRLLRKRLSEQEEESTCLERKLANWESTVQGSEQEVAHIRKLRVAASLRGTDSNYNDTLGLYVQMEEAQCMEAEKRMRQYREAEKQAEIRTEQMQAEAERLKEWSLEELAFEESVYNRLQGAHNNMADSKGSVQERLVRSEVYADKLSQAYDTLENSHEQLAARKQDLDEQYADLSRTCLRLEGDLSEAEQQCDMAERDAAHARDQENEVEARAEARRDHFVRISEDLLDDLNILGLRGELLLQVKGFVDREVGRPEREREFVAGVAGFLRPAVEVNAPEAVLEEDDDNTQT